MLSLSPTTFKKINDCPLQYLKHIEKEPYNVNERLFMDYTVTIDFIGKLVEATTFSVKQNIPDLVYNLKDEDLQGYFNEVFQNYMKNNSSKKTFRLGEEETIDGLKTALLLTCKNVYTYLRNNKLLTPNHFMPKYPLGTYREPIIYSKDISLYGYIDLFVRRADGIVALKIKPTLTTDKFIDVVQLKLYAFIIKHILLGLSRPYVNVFYAYYLPKTDIYREFPFTNEDNEEIVKILNKSLVTVTERKFLATPSREKCVICSYKENCEFQYQLKDDENLFDVLKDLDAF